MDLFLSKDKDLPLIFHIFSVPQQNSIRIIILQQTDLLTFCHQHRKCSIGQITDTAYRKRIRNSLHCGLDIHIPCDHDTKHLGCQRSQDISLYTTSQSV